MRYDIILEKRDDSSGTCAPELLGGAAVDETRADIEELILEAVELHVEDMQFDSLS